MGDKTERIASVAQELGDELADGEPPREGWFAWTRRQFFKNLFPIIVMGLMGGGVTAWNEMGKDVQEAHQRVSDNQYAADHDRAQIKADVAYKFQWAQEVVARNAAEMIALKDRVQQLEIEAGIMRWRLDMVDRSGPARATEGAPDPGRGPPINWREIAERIHELSKKHEVDPDEVQRYLEQRDAPIQAPALPRAPRGDRAK